MNFSFSNKNLIWGIALLTAGLLLLSFFITFGEGHGDFTEAQLAHLSGPEGLNCGNQCGALVNSDYDTYSAKILEEMKSNPALFPSTLVAEYESVHTNVVDSGVTLTAESNTVADAERLNEELSPAQEKLFNTTPDHLEDIAVANSLIPESVDVVVGTSPTGVEQTVTVTAENYEQYASTLNAISTPDADAFSTFTKAVQEEITVAVVEAAPEEDKEAVESTLVDTYASDLKEIEALKTKTETILEAALPSGEPFVGGGFAPTGLVGGVPGFEGGLPSGLPPLPPGLVNFGIPEGEHSGFSEGGLHGMPPGFGGGFPGQMPGGGFPGGFPTGMPPGSPIGEMYPPGFRPDAGSGFSEGRPYIGPPDRIGPPGSVGPPDRIGPFFDDRYDDRYIGGDEGFFHQPTAEEQKKMTEQAVLEMTERGIPQADIDLAIQYMTGAGTASPKDEEAFFQEMHQKFGDDRYAGGDHGLPLPLPYLGLPPGTDGVSYPAMDYSKMSAGDMERIATEAGMTFDPTKAAEYSGTYLPGGTYPTPYAIPVGGGLFGDHQAYPYPGHTFDFGSLSPEVFYSTLYSGSPNYDPTAAYTDTMMHQYQTGSTGGTTWTDSGGTTYTQSPTPTYDMGGYTMPSDGGHTYTMPNLYSIYRNWYYPYYYRR